MADVAGEIAAACGVSKRHVQNLFNQGMPRTVEEAVAWYRQQKQEREKRRTETLDEARRRKTEAEAGLAELELARARGEVVSIQEVTEEVGVLMDRLRAAVLAAPGKWTPQIIGVSDMPTASALMAALTEELLGALSVDDDDSG